MGGAQGVNRWPHRQGGRRKDLEKVRKAVELSAAGNTRQQIAKYFGVSRSTVDNWLKAKLPETIEVVPEIVTPVPEPVVSPVPKVPERPLFALECVRGGNLGSVRRWNCPRLRQCELEFIMEYGSAQGACPKDCPGP